MTDLTIRLAELKAVAEKATPGPWLNFALMVVSPSTKAEICDTVNGTPSDNRLANADHIATFDPPTVLALIAAVEGVVALIGEHARREAHNEALSISDIADLLPEPTSEEYRRAVTAALGIEATS